MRGGNTIAVNLIHPWLQSYYLPFNLVRPITPFKSIKDVTPKVLPMQQELCPSENLGGSILV